jgi:hypothetical protein
MSNLNVHENNMTIERRSIIQSIRNSKKISRMFRQILAYFYLIENDEGNKLYSEAIESLKGSIKRGK